MVRAHQGDASASLDRCRLDRQGDRAPTGVITRTVHAGAGPAMRLAWGEILAGRVLASGVVRQNAWAFKKKKGSNERVEIDRCKLC